MGSSLSGKDLSSKIREELTRKIKDLKKNNKYICLANILVGKDGGSKSYFNAQNRACEKVGILTKNLVFDENVEEEVLINTIKELNDDEGVNGIILQLPLPKNFDENRITSFISYKKDIDCLSAESIGKFYKNEISFLPCTPKGIITLLKESNVKIEGSRAVVLGRSNIVGKPISNLLLKENATVTICHSKTKDLKKICLEADILIVAIGKPLFIDSSFVKEGAIVIDVGTTYVNGKIVGDVNFQEVLPKAKLITPVPGGVGPMTTTVLLENLFEGI